MTEIKSFKHLVFEFLGKDVIIYSTNTLGVRNNTYSTSLGMIKYFINKMELRDKNISFLSEEDEFKLVNPNKGKKDNLIFTKIFGSFIAGKEDNNE